MGAGIALGFDYPQLRKGRTTQGQTGQNRWFCGEVCPSQESKSARLEIFSGCKRLVYIRGCQEHFSPSAGGAGFGSRDPAPLTIEDARLVSCPWVIPSQ